LGITYEEAFGRELFEELALRAEDIPWRFMGHLTPHRHGVSAFMQVYEIRDNRTPAYNRNDFIESFWLSPQEVLARIETGDKAKDDLPRLIHWMLEMIPTWR